ncbi:MAG: hypothetical protein ACE5I2_07915 [Anaerolineae bacterium]
MSPARKYFFSEEDDRLIRDRYDSRTQTIDELAALLRAPRGPSETAPSSSGLAPTRKGSTICGRWRQSHTGYPSADPPTGSGPGWSLGRASNSIR